MRDDESSYLTLEVQDNAAMHQLQGTPSPIELQWVHNGTINNPSWEGDDFGTSQVGKITGFSLHADFATKTQNRKKTGTLVPLYFTLCGIRKAIGTDFAG